MATIKVVPKRKPKIKVVPLAPAKYRDRKKTA